MRILFSILVSVVLSACVIDGDANDRNYHATRELNNPDVWDERNAEVNNRKN